MTHIGDHPLPEMYGAGLTIDVQCARCGSSIDSERCDNCDDGFDGHECGEDTCCCADPGDNVACDICHGSGVIHRCLSSYEFCTANPLPGREQIQRGQLEWFTMENQR